MMKDENEHDWLLYDRHSVENSGTQKRENNGSSKETV